MEKYFPTFCVLYAMRIFTPMSSNIALIFLENFSEIFLMYGLKQWMLISVFLAISESNCFFFCICFSIKLFRKEFLYQELFNFLPVVVLCIFWDEILYFFFSRLRYTGVIIHENARAYWFSEDCWCYYRFVFIATCVSRNGSLPSWQV